MKNLKALALTATLAFATAAPAFAAQVNNEADAYFDRMEQIKQNNADNNPKLACQAVANMEVAVQFATFRSQEARRSNIELGQAQNNWCIENGYGARPTVTASDFNGSQTSFYGQSVPGLPAGMTMAEAVTLAQQGVSGPESLELDRKCRSKFGNGSSYMRGNSVPSRGEYVCSNGRGGRIGTL